MTAYRGNADVRTARFEDWSGVAQLPPDVAVTLIDPRGAVVVAAAPAIALPGPIAAGAPTHSYTWTPPVNANLGTWTETWTATVLGEPTISSGTFRMSDSLRAGGTKPIDDPGPTQAILQTYDPLLASNLRAGLAAKATARAPGPAIASPSSDTVGTKTAIDAIIAALRTGGVTL